MAHDIYIPLVYGLVIFIYLLPVMLVGFLAFSKGRSILAWLFITFFTGVLGVAVLALLPPTAAKKRRAMPKEGPVSRAAYNHDQFSN